MTISKIAQSQMNYDSYSSENAESDFLKTFSEMVAEKPQVSQREMAKKTGVSLGMINNLLGRCAARGWIALQRMNKRKISYVITPEGMSEVVRRSVSFVKRNFSQLKIYSKNIELFIKNAAKNGITEVILCGHSEMQVFIENACKNNKLKFFFCEEINFNCLQNQLVILGDEYENSHGRTVSVYEMVENSGFC